LFQHRAGSGGIELQFNDCHEYFVVELQHYRCWRFQHVFDCLDAFDVVEFLDCVIGLLVIQSVIGKQQHGSSRLLQFVILVTVVYLDEIDCLNFIDFAIICFVGVVIVEFIICVFGIVYLDNVQLFDSIVGNAIVLFICV